MFACGQSWPSGNEGRRWQGGLRGQVDGMFGQLQSEADVGHCRWRVNGANCSVRENVAALHSERMKQGASSLFATIP